jgi:hypothetical protein
MIGTIEIALIAIMIGKNPFTGEVELQYQAVGQYKSISACTVEKNRLLNKDKGIAYLCVKLDYD